MHHVWHTAPNAPPSPPPDSHQPHLIKSKTYESVGSKLLSPTAAYLAKYTVAEDDGAPKEAFGHPIEPEYQQLARKTAATTGGGTGAAGGGGGQTSPGSRSSSRASNGNPPLSPSRSQSSEQH